MTPTSMRRSWAFSHRSVLISPKVSPSKGAERRRESLEEELRHLRLTPLIGGALLRGPAPRSPVARARRTSPWRVLADNFTMSSSASSVLAVVTSPHRPVALRGRPGGCCRPRDQHHRRQRSLEECRRTRRSGPSGVTRRQTGPPGPTTVVSTSSNDMSTCSSADARSARSWSGEARPMFSPSKTVRSSTPLSEGTTIP